ncbi:MAG: sugar transferase [Verrucomicrobia bacterium]|nr:sugar transferase [Verrucomicrobiota bacterium]
MLRRNRQLRTQLSKVSDGGLFCLALWVAHFLRSSLFQNLPELEHRTVEPFYQFLWLWLIIFPGTPLILEWQGFYERPLLPRRSDTAWVLFRSSLLVTIGVILAMFPLKLALARSVIILFGLTSFALALLREELMRGLFRLRMTQPQWRQRVILVGDAADNARSRQELLASTEEGLDPVAEFDLNAQGPGVLIELLHQHSANGVIIQGRHSNLGQIEEVIRICELEGVEAWLVADFFKTRISRKNVDEFHGRPTLVFRTAPEASWPRAAKDLMDFLGAILLLAISSVFLLLAAVLIKLTSPGPVLFRQRRCGLNGQPFTMLKFRSMVTDAEQRQHELAQFNEMSGPVFKIANDPRITRIGKYLRRFSIDELPQLVNVLRGEMSLVGPRPLPVEEVRRFQDIAHRRRLSVKPGLTCLWQISGRNEVKNFEEWVQLDLEYIDHWSLWLDWKILLKTILVVLRGEGAR